MTVTVDIIAQSVVVRPAPQARVTVVASGAQGPEGIAGVKGDPGADGAGVPAGGIDGQLLLADATQPGGTRWSSNLLNFGNITAASVIELSDQRVKANIKPMRGALNVIMALKPVSFFSKITKENEVGLIAQQVAAVMPEVVHFDKTLGLNYGRLVAPLIGAVQTQQKQLRALWWLVFILLCSLLWGIISPAHAMSAPSIELSGTGVVISATKSGQIANITNVYVTKARVGTGVLGDAPLTIDTTSDAVGQIGLHLKGASGTSGTAVQFTNPGISDWSVGVNGTTNALLIQTNRYSGSAGTLVAYFDTTGLTVGGVAVAGTIGGALISATGATGTVTATNVYAKSVSGSTGTFGTMAGILTTAAQTNITSLGSLTGLTMAGNIAMGGNSITGGGTATFTTLAGTLSTAAQPNITSVGTLSSISDSGVLNVGGAVSTSSVIFSGGLLTANAGITVTGAVTATTGSFTNLSGAVISATAPTGTVTATWGYFNKVSATTATLGTIGAGAINTNGLLTASAGEALTGGLTVDTISTTGKVSATASYIGNLTEAVVSQTATTSTTFLNTSVGGQFFVTASSSTLISLTNGTPGKAVQIVVKQDATGGRAITYTSPTHHWSNASFTSSGAITSTSMITSGSTFSQWVWTTPDGSTWLGGLAGSGM